MHVHTHIFTFAFGSYIPALYCALPFARFPTATTKKHHHHHSSTATATHSTATCTAYTPHPHPYHLHTALPALRDRNDPAPHYPALPPYGERSQKNIAFARLHACHLHTRTHARTLSSALSICHLSLTHMPVACTLCSTTLSDQWVVFSREKASSLTTYVKITFHYACHVHTHTHCVENLCANGCPWQKGQPLQVPLHPALYCTAAFCPICSIVVMPVNRSWDSGNIMAFMAKTDS